MLLRHDPAPLAHVLDDFEGDSTERLTGFTAPAVADPDPDDVLLYIYAFAVRRRPPKNCDPALLLSYDGKPHSPLFWVKAGNRWHVARLETDRKRLLFRASPSFLSASTICADGFRSCPWRFAFCCWRSRSRFAARGARVSLFLKVKAGLRPSALSQSSRLISRPTRLRPTR